MDLTVSLESKYTIKLAFGIKLQFLQELKMSVP